MNERWKNRLLGLVAAVALMLVVGLMTRWYLDLPEVRYDSGSRKPRSCAHDGTGWKHVPASDPRCKDVLVSRHHAVWSDPDNYYED